MQTIKILVIFLLALSLFSCKEDDPVKPVISKEPTPVDNLIWKITTTDNNHSIALPIGTDSKFNGKTLEVGDRIGVFFKDGKNYKCAGSVNWESGKPLNITVWGDDSRTSNIKEGFTVNEKMEWYLYRKENGKSYKAKVKYESGPQNYQVNGLSILLSFQVK